ncbi:hypothetical protein [Flavobacterium sp.]|uniref:hypothetical protein n=1 Tax=Flavobacterium sp. TaxID=239 RepID=UPI001B79009F|nr:hypothetical protein [Flavobacterium sp.]MBP6127486.1 hypothetical protein [Flavobacterium sp.]
MKEDLIELLSRWKNDERRIGFRNVKVRNTPFADGEYLIIVSEELKIKDNSKTIKIERVFQTFNQSGNNEIANGDLYRAEQIVNIITIEFFKLYLDTIQELYLEYDGDFTELN